MSFITAATIALHWGIKVGFEGAGRVACTLVTPGRPIRGGDKVGWKVWRSHNNQLESVTLKRFLCFGE